MSGGEMTPERLDAILDGRDAATDDDARDMLALAGALREATPGAPDALRARLRTLRQPRPGWFVRLRASGWRGRALVAAPALSAVAVAVIAFGVIGGSPQGQPAGADSSQAEQLSQSRGTSESAPATGTRLDAAKAAPDALSGALSAPVVVLVAPTTLTARLADVRSLVTAAGGTVAEEVPQPATPAGVVVVLTLPQARRDEVLRAIVALGTDAAADVTLPALPAPAGDRVRTGAADAPTAVRVLLTEGP